MKLLFDENISYRILKKINALFPDSEQVFNLNLGGKKDREIWEFAQNNEFIVVTHDEDFRDLSTVWGAPPKIIWLNTGNIRVQSLADLLISKRKEILLFADDPASSCLEILYR
jgi:predicted nuclease of predicted toxin-antitoxin system